MFTTTCRPDCYWAAYSAEEQAECDDVRCIEYREGASDEEVPAWLLEQVESAHAAGPYPGLIHDGSSDTLNSLGGRS